MEELLERRPVGDELLRYELWKEQNGWCLYSGEQIKLEWIAGDDNRVQIDHILPWSRFGDDSFMNKTLCLASANQAKKNRTPYEWYEEEGLDWPLFSSRVEGCKEMKGRKKGGFYLRKNAKEVEETFKESQPWRHPLCHAVAAGHARSPIPKGRQAATFFARPGQLTAKLRRAWGLEDLKKDDKGNRLEDDRHHALDAIVVAATTQAMLQRLTIAVQEAKRQGLPRGFDFTQAPPPAAGFREVVRATVGNVFVSRADRHRARGEAHAATIKRVEVVDGVETVFERKAVGKADTRRLRKYPSAGTVRQDRRSRQIAGRMVVELRRWIEAGRPKDESAARSRKKVMSFARFGLRAKIRSLFRCEAVRRIAARWRGSTFSRKRISAGRVRYYLVPIYPHQIADQENYPQPPNRSAVAYVAEADWPLIDAPYDFRFSLYETA